jgi:acyl carrier protein
MAMALQCDVWQLSSEEAGHMTEEASWLLEWFTRRNEGAGNVSGIRLGSNYFEMGLVDSFGVIELIAGIEERFEIRFNERHFQDRRFSTIEGLSTIIAELSNSREIMESTDER